MSPKPDTWIREMALNHHMIDPFVDHQVREMPTHQPLPEPDDDAILTRKVISYGLSSYGYDIRLANQFYIFTNTLNPVIDPKAFPETAFVHVEGDICIIPPNSYILANSLERLRIPRDIFCICLGKSSYCRAGIIVNVTPLEPGWQGVVTLEIANGTPLPVKIYAYEGIAQVLFFEGAAPCETSYADRHGKYQGQRGITLPRL